MVKSVDLRVVTVTTGRTARVRIPAGAVDFFGESRSLGLRRSQPGGRCSPQVRKPLILEVGRIEHLVFSDKDDKFGGPVCTLRTLKIPWQLKIEKE